MDRLLQEVQSAMVTRVATLTRCERHVAKETETNGHAIPKHENKEVKELGVPKDDSNIDHMLDVMSAHDRKASSKL